MDIAQRFIDALHALEADRDAAPISALYAIGAIAGNTGTTQVHDPGEFWVGYREGFTHIRSDFRTVVASGDTVALEWVSTGEMEGGDPVEYEGVTMLETDGERITRSTAYFDPRALIA